LAQTAKAKYNTKYNRNKFLHIRYFMVNYALKYQSILMFNFINQMVVQIEVLFQYQTTVI